jgi:hypothetical protein
VRRNGITRRKQSIAVLFSGTQTVADNDKITVHAITLMTDKTTTITQNISNHNGRCAIKNTEANYDFFFAIYLNLPA